MEVSNEESAGTFAGRDLALWNELLVLDLAVQAAAAQFDCTLLLYETSPETSGLWQRLYFDFRDNQRRAVMKPSANEIALATYILAADRFTWQTLLRGELSIARALEARILSLRQGDATTFHEQIPALQTLVDAASNISLTMGGETPKTPQFSSELAATTAISVPEAVIDKDASGIMEAAKASDPTEEMATPAVPVSEATGPVTRIALAQPSVALARYRQLRENRLKWRELRAERNADRSGWSRFRFWRNTRPFWGSVLLIMGGALVLWGPLVLLQYAFLPGSTLWEGLVVGGLMVAMGLVQLLAPRNSMVTGAIGIVLSLASLIVALGGLGFGMILGLIGGALGVAWRPASRAAGKSKHVRVRT